MKTSSFHSIFENNENLQSITGENFNATCINRKLSQENIIVPKNAQIKNVQNVNQNQYHHQHHAPLVKTTSVINNFSFNNSPSSPQNRNLLGHKSVSQTNSSNLTTSSSRILNNNTHNNNNNNRESSGILYQPFPISQQPTKKSQSITNHINHQHFGLTKTNSSHSASGSSIAVKTISHSDYTLTKRDYKKDKSSKSASKNSSTNNLVSKENHEGSERTKSGNLKNKLKSLLTVSNSNNSQYSTSLLAQNSSHNNNNNKENLVRGVSSTGVPVSQIDQSAKDNNFIKKNSLGRSTSHFHGTDFSLGLGR